MRGKDNMKNIMYVGVLALCIFCRPGTASAAESPVVNFSAADVNPAFNVSFSIMLAGSI